MSQTFKAHLLVFLATFLVAGSFIASAKLSGVIDSISLTLFRFVLASLFLSPIIFLNKKFRIKVLSTLPRAMIISLFYSFYFILFFKALESTTALNAGTLYTLVPLLTAIFCIFIFKDKISFFQMILYFIGIVGTCIVVFKGNLELFFSFSLNHGDFIFLIATVFMALYSISLKFLHKKDDELLVLVFTTLIGGCLWMFLALEILDIPMQWEKIQGDLIFYMAYLVIGTTVITVYLYQKASIIIGPKKLMAYVYLNPAMVAVLMYIFEGKLITSWIFVGILISAFATIVLLKQK
ncbi:DMT family transporter [Arcobacter caeni]|uniref:EamA family transporter n=1 Tax=Arcobacter caeni TaxID=1912877 RepID=A0A363CXE4_9BACT|nr:DMT family transporter [Arcobacter caeni]PUE63457.1 EamA family transporter [Arcobacter caeni]